MLKKTLSIVAAMAMALAFQFPVGMTAFAQENEPVGTEYNDSEVMTNVKYIDKDGNVKECTSATVVNDSMKGDWNAGWYVVNRDVTMHDASVTCKGNVNLILVDGCTLDVYGKKKTAGMRVSGSDSSINIYGQGLSKLDEAGTIKAHGGTNCAGIQGQNINLIGCNVSCTGGDSGAGIGGGKSEVGKKIYINYCNVTANGGRRASGIGGGEDRAGEDITIVEHSRVNADGNYGGAGVGGGEGGNGINITIDRSWVFAHGKYDGAGIGGGEDGFGRYITIKNYSHVRASGGSKDGGAGIGGGEDSMGDFIDITGGSTVEAWGGDDSAGIGGGEDRGGYNINIVDSTVRAYGDENGAGIGGGEDGDGVNITINEGNVTAQGGFDGAGIGGGDSGKGRNIKIIDSNIKAYGGNGGGAGIGGGYEQNADGIFFEKCRTVIAVGIGRADAVGSAKGCGKSSNIKVQKGAYINGTEVTDGEKDQSETFFNMHQAKISRFKHNGQTEEHNWTFTAEGPVITATCSNTEHESFSSEQITLCEPENPVFDGNSKEVRVNGFIDGVETPDVKYYRNGKLLTEAPYSVGTYIARLTLGEATAELAYSIEKGNIEECDIILTPVAFAFNNQVHKPEVTVRNVGRYDMKASKDYTVTVEEGKNVGSYAVTVKGKGDYSSWKTVSYSINPAPKAIKTIKKGKKTLTVKWKKSSKAYRAQTTGYQIMYSTSSSFDSAKTVTVKGKYTSKTIKKLKRHKKYYVKIRAYKNVNGQKYWSTWSKVKVKRTR